MRGGINVRKSFHQLLDTLTNFHSESIFHIALDLRVSPAPQIREIWSWRQDGDVRAIRNAAVFLLRIASELAFQVRRNMRDDHRVFAIITQLEHVTDAMNLRDERRLIGRDPKM